jgi:hypothetical protein
MNFNFAFRPFETVFHNLCADEKIVIEITFEKSNPPKKIKIDEN